MRHETYIDVLKSVFLTVVCLVFFPLLLPAISPSQDPIGAPENLLIFGVFRPTLEADIFIFAQHVGMALCNPRFQSDSSHERCFRSLN